MIKQWLAAAMIFVAAACTATGPVAVNSQTVQQTVEVPASLAQVCAIPTAPQKGASQRDVAIYVLDLREALEACQTRHSALVDVIEDYRARIASANADNL